MTLPVSGAISMSQVNTELGLSATAQISLNDAAVRTLAGVPSGAISLDNLHGKANEFTLTISADTNDLNVATAATSAGWNGSSKLYVVIDSGVYVSSTSTANAAMTISGSFPNGLFVTNNGYIVGMGGAGGDGRSAVFTYNSYTYGGTNGGNGGTALSVSSATSFTNNGTIAGGGGGGGGGAAVAWSSCDAGGVIGGSGGGGGRSSKTNSPGGAGGGGSIGGPWSYSVWTGNTGNAGTYTAAGAQKAGRTVTYTAGYGGAGGGWGSSGSSGGSAYGPQTGTTGGMSGGSGGACLSGNSNITWVATGTRLGSIS